MQARARVSGSSKARDATRRASAGGKLTHIPAAHSTRSGRLFEPTQILTKSVSVTDRLATAHIAYLLRHEVQGPIFRLNEDAIQIFERDSDHHKEESKTEGHRCHKARPP